VKPLRTLVTVWLTATVMSVAGCAPGDEGPPFEVSPTHGSLFGHEDVSLAGDLSALGDVTEVRIAGARAYRVEVREGALHAITQGAPTPGRADVELIGTRGRAVRRGAFTFDPPRGRAPLVWAAFGASLTQGTGGLGIDAHTQTHGVAALVARAAGVYLGLPLFADGLATPLQPTDFSIDCVRRPGAGLDASRLVQMVTDPATGDFDLRRGRIDPTLAEVRDLAVGGSKLEMQATGGQGVIALLEHVTSSPDVAPEDVFSPPRRSQLDRLEALDADVMFSTDLLANDLDPAAIELDDVHLDRNTPLADAQPFLDEIVDRLGRLRGHLFVATMFPLDFLPNLATVRARRIADGSDTDASFDAKVATLNAQVDAYNAALIAAAARHPRVHVVDVRPLVDSLRTDGIVVGGERLRVARWGGLLSLDDLHFSDTGYALYANVFLDAIDGALGLGLPRVDVEAVHADDALAPSKLRALGYTCVP